MRGNVFSDLINPAFFPFQSTTPPLLSPGRPFSAYVRGEFNERSSVLSPSPSSSSSSSYGADCSSGHSRSRSLSWSKQEVSLLLPVRWCGGERRRKKKKKKKLPLLRRERRRPGEWLWRGDNGSTVLSLSLSLGNS